MPGLTQTVRPVGATRPLRHDWWGLILAGGEGTRLRSLTERIAGDDRPKQFCPILGRDTLLAETRQRAALAVSPHRTLVVVTETHERFYAPLLADVWSRQIVVQPESRGTAPAILYALLRLHTMAPADPVAIFPSDHYVSDDEAFMAHVRAAFGALTVWPDLVVLLGIRPDGLQDEYGWIEPGETMAAPTQPWPWSLHRVRRFWEKPSRALGETLRHRGCLWNSFVLVARIPALLRLMKDTVPDLYQAFGPIRPTLNTRREAAAVRALYAGLPVMDFSRQVLSAPGANLAVLRVSGVGWNDLGDPGRVMATQRQLAGALR